MINIELKLGDLIRYKYNYNWEYRILTTLDGGGIIKFNPPTGFTTVIEGVWKKRVFCPRKIVKI